MKLANVENRIHASLIDSLGPDLFDETGKTPQELRTIIETRLRELLQTEETPLSSGDKVYLVDSILNNILGYGPIEEYLTDPDVSEIMVNNAHTIYIERFGKIHGTDRFFIDENHLMRIINKIVSQVGRRIDESSPMVDARLTDGSRVNAIIHPLAINGPMLTIRKFAADPYMVDDLVHFGTLSSRIARLLESCVRGRLNVIVSGGTGTGKTTTLNVLSSFIPPDERIITIEDAAELQLRQEHVLRLESRPPNIEGHGEVRIRDLVRNSLRMRPDRIVVGEVRGGEALDMLQAMNTGHDGSLSTVHSNSPRDTLSRIETMALMAGMELPVKAIRDQIAAAINLIIHQSRLRDGSRKITHITEVLGMEGDIITLQDIFVYDFSMGVNEQGDSIGQIKSTGIRPAFLEKLKDQGIEIDPEIFEYEPLERA